jgi:hypothetical protein
LTSRMLSEGRSVSSMMIAIMLEFIWVKGRGERNEAS